MQVRAITALLALTVLACPAFAQTYSEPFAASHGWTWTATVATCDNSATNGDDATNGNAAPSVHVTCNGRNDNHTGYWKKSLTWEDMGVTAGETVTEVDGKFDEAILDRTHSTAPSHGPLELFDSADTSECAAADLEDVASHAAGTGGTSWATVNVKGVIAINAGCQASTTTITIRAGMNASTGNNASANTQHNLDNVVLVITSVAPGSAKPRRRIIRFGGGLM